MDANAAMTATMGWATANVFQLIATVVVVCVYLVLDRISAPKLEESAFQGKFKSGEASNAILIGRFLAGLAGVLILVVVWGIEIGSIMVFASTAITLLGVALFAQWSILSNITAHFVLLLQPSFKRGTFIRVFDADNYVEGYVVELSFFSTKLITENRETVIYPNNLILSRPAVINPRDRLVGVGKLPTSDPIPGKLE